MSDKAKWGEALERCIQILEDKWEDDNTRQARVELAAARELIEAARKHLEVAHGSSYPEFWANPETTMYELAVALAACEKPAP